MPASASASDSVVAGGLPVGPWGARTVGGAAGADAVLAGDGNALFTVLNNSTPVQTLRRLDPSTAQVRATRRGTYVDGGAVILAGRLWVVSLDQHADQLQALDLNTLATTAAIDVVGTKRMQDAAIVGAVTATGRIYLLYNSNHIAVIDAARQRVIHRYTIPGKDVDAAVDPDGTHMYVVTTAAHGSTQTPALTVRDPDTGEVLLTSDYHPRIGPGMIDVVAASRGGVWISEGSGMTHLAAFHPADDLDSTTRASGTSSGGLPLTVTLSSTVAWLGSQTKLLCADPDTGTVRAGTDPGARGSHALDLFDITKAGSRIFADYYGRRGARRLVTMNPPHNCRG